MKMKNPVLLVIALAELIVRGTLNVRDHQSDHFKRAVTERRLRIQIEGWRDCEVKVCDDPENKGRKVVTSGNISVSAALEGFKMDPDIWDKLIPKGKITVRDYGKLTSAQIDFQVMDHGEVGLTLKEAYLNVERAYLADRNMSVDDLAVRFNEILHGVLRGRKVELTGNEEYDREAISKRWRGLLTQNWMRHIQMRGISLVYKDHLARLESPNNKEAGLFHFGKNEYTALHKAWKQDRDDEALQKQDESGLPPEMAKCLDGILKNREDKANKTKAPAVAVPEMLTLEKVNAIQSESPSGTVKTLCQVIKGATVSEFAALEKALAETEKTEGNPLYDFFNKVAVAAK